MAAGVLDIEDAEQRFLRLQNTLQKLNDTAQSTSSNNGFSFLSVDANELSPSNDLLSRVQAFLPAIQASNAVLGTQDPARIDIEHIESASGPYIQMNLGLGLFDVRGSTPLNAAAPVFSLFKSPSTTSSSHSSDDWDSDEDSDAEIITSFKPVRPIKPLPRRAIREMHTQVRPSIAVLHESSTESDCGPRNGEEG